MGAGRHGWDELVGARHTQFHRGVALALDSCLRRGSCVTEYLVCPIFIEQYHLLISRLQDALIHLVENQFPVIILTCIYHAVSTHFAISLPFFVYRRLSGISPLLLSLSQQS